MSGLRELTSSGSRGGFGPSGIGSAFGAQRLRGRDCSRLFQAQEPDFSTRKVSVRLPGCHIGHAITIDTPPLRLTIPIVTASLAV